MAGQAQVSVVIPCYRCTGTLARAVASVVTQTVQPKEVILVDDCSSDGTLEELYRLQRMHPDGWIKVIALPKNEGPAIARNMAWDSATQPFIAFLDSDDAWHPQKIEIQYHWMLAHPEVALTGHACRYIKGSCEANTNLHYETCQVPFKLVTKRRLLMSNQFSTPSVMLRREIPQRFLHGKRYSEDYLLWCEICASGLPCCYSELSLAYLYKAPYGEGGLSGQMLKMEKGELAVYRSLYAKQYYEFCVLAFLTCWSCLKYFYRLCKVKIFRFGAMG